AQDATLRIEFDLANTGARSGTEVAQVYVRPPRGPNKVLRAFRRVTLDPGEKAQVAMDLKVADLSRYDAKSKRYVVDAGRYQLMVGASSADLREQASFEVEPP